METFELTFVVTTHGVGTRLKGFPIDSSQADWGELPHTDDHEHTWIVHALKSVIYDVTHNDGVGEFSDVPPGKYILPSGKVMLIATDSTVTFSEESA